MGVQVREVPEAIDELWVTDVLEGAGVADGGKVTAVELAGWIGTGQTGRNARYSLTWDAPDGRPATVVAKLPTDDAAARSAAFGNGAYLKEWTFYTQVASTVDVRTPAVHAACFDADRMDFVLLMEDISGAEQGDQLDGLTVDQAALAVEQAVALHAPRWGDASLDAVLDAAMPPEQRGMFLSMVYGATMEGFLERLGPRLDDDVVDLVRTLSGSVAAWAAAVDTPATVVHMDFRPDNLLFGVEPGAPPVVVVDWQTATTGPGATDLAYLLGGSFLPDQRARVEGELVESYREQLVARGISYDADTCWRDYRVGSLWGVAMSVIATMLAVETERGNDMLTAMAQRHGRHALDLDALSLL